MFTGDTVTIVTPMDEKGNICRISLRKLTDYHVANGTSAIISADTTSEPATLDHDEHADVVVMTLELADGRIPVTAGTGANATVGATSLTRRFNDNGVAGCLAVTPYYNRPSQEGLHQHFKVITERADLSQILYSVPSRTDCDLLPETVGRLTKVKNTIEIRETTGNLMRVNQIKELVSNDFVLLNDDGASALDFTQLDGYRVISVTANVAAHDMAQICKLAAEGYFAEARAINQHLMSLYNKLFVEPNPIPVRWACKELSLVATDMLRLPMTPITGSSRETVRATLKHTSLL